MSSAAFQFEPLEADPILDAPPGVRQEREQIHHLRLEMPDDPGVRQHIEARLDQPIAHPEFPWGRSPFVFPARHGADCRRLAREPRPHQ